MPEQRWAGGQPNLRAVDVMRRSVAMGDHETVHAAWELMRRSGLTHVPVVRYGRTVGLLDDPQLLRAIVHGMGGGGARPVATVASGRWLAVDEGDGLRAVYERLVRAGLPAAVVLDRNRSPLGVITREEALDALHPRAQS
jgi:CBS domain-containing protein